MFRRIVLSIGLSIFFSENLHGLLHSHNLENGREEIELCLFVRGEELCELVSCLKIERK